MSRLFKRGFTLVEMMVAVAILAISAIFIYSSNSNAIRHQLMLEETTLGHWLLLNAIEEEKIARTVSPETASDELKRKQVPIGEKEYEIIVTDLEHDSDSVLMLEFAIYLIDPDTGNHLVDHVITMLRKSE